MDTGDLVVITEYLTNLKVPDKYPLPFVTNCTHLLHGAKLVLKVDLVRAYQPIPVHKEYIGKTAIITLFGPFKFCYMTFGLHNATTQTFQRFMNQVSLRLDFVMF